LQDYKCPQCKDTFIEEIDESNSANDGGISSQNASGFSFSTDFGGGQGGRVDLLQVKIENEIDRRYHLG